MLFIPPCLFSIDETYRAELKRLSNLENDHKRRDRLFIIAEILKIAQDGCLKTQIMYRANLSFAQLNDYLSFLIKMDLLKLQNQNKKTIYITTPNGEKYLEKYGDIAMILGNIERNS